uniref:Variable lymphocyte receptor n=1 Tax=Lethenteron appendix TaxID=104630 RepID=Q4KP04_LETAP|nr:variable lymphocyte receptor [Lethenteron appendix]
MWIKWIATLVAFGALVQSAVACPSQCSCGKESWAAGLQATNCAGKGLSSVPAGIPDNTQALSVGSNRIESLPEGVFDRLVNLQWLSLDSNQLKALPAWVFDKLTQLTGLDLNRNQLQALPTGMFDRLGNLQRFDLSRNQLKSVTRGAFDNLKSLTHIWLYGNPWDCQCTDILYLSGWVAQHSGIVRGNWDGSSYAVNPDSAKCSGTNTPVRAVTEASTSPSKCPGYVATTTTPTTTTPEFIPETTTSPQPVITTQKPKHLMNFNCTSILERKNDGGDCGKPACTTLLNCANFLSCLCSTCALCRKR